MLPRYRPGEARRPWRRGAQRVRRCLQSGSGRCGLKLFGSRDTSKRLLKPQSAAIQATNPATVQAVGVLGNQQLKAESLNSPIRHFMPAAQFGDEPEAER